MIHIDESIGGTRGKCCGEERREEWVVLSHEASPRLRRDVTMILFQIGALRLRG